MSCLIIKYVPTILNPFPEVNNGNFTQVLIRELLSIKNRPMISHGPVFYARLENDFCSTVGLSCRSEDSGENLHGDPCLCFHMNLAFCQRLGPYSYRQRHRVMLN